MSSLKLKTPSGGSVSFNAADTANDVTLSVPASNATLLTTSGDGSALTNLPVPAALSTASGSAPSYSARAWVNFNGTGTVAIRDSGNVSSITDNGTGDYTVNFTTAMPDNNYCVSSFLKYNGEGFNDGGFLGQDFSQASSASSFPCFTYRLGTGTNAIIDFQEVHILFIR